MIDQDIKFTVSPKVHALAILPTDEYSKKSHIHPILVVANEDGYARWPLGEMLLEVLEEVR